MDPYQEWKEFTGSSTHKAECAHCNVTTTDSTKGWVFRYIGVRGEGRHGKKVRTIRLCPECRKKLGE